MQDASEENLQVFSDVLLWLIWFSVYVALPSGKALGMHQENRCISFVISVISIYERILRDVSA